jgi:hypothetical protein
MEIDAAQQRSDRHGQPLVQLGLRGGLPMIIPLALKHAQGDGLAGGRMERAAAAGRANAGAQQGMPALESVQRPAQDIRRGGAGHLDDTHQVERRKLVRPGQGGFHAAERAVQAGVHLVGAGAASHYFTARGEST